MATPKSANSSPKRKREKFGDVQTLDIPGRKTFGGNKKPKVAEDRKIKSAKFRGARSTGNGRKNHGETEKSWNTPHKSVSKKLWKTDKSSTPKSTAKLPKSVSNSGASENTFKNKPPESFLKSPSSVTKNAERKSATKPLDRKARKEIAEFRKKNRKPNYELEKDVKKLWEKTRQRNLDSKERSKLVSDILRMMKGKLAEMSSSHISSRVVQTCVKYCQPEERDEVFEELRPHTLSLTHSTYAYHIVLKMLDHASKTQMQQMISILHGNCVSLLRHPVGSAVVEHAFQLASGAQKREMVSEFYSPEYGLFKGIMTAEKHSLADLLANESAQKRLSMLQHMTLSLQPILEKGIVDHSITHRVLAEYLSVSTKSMIEDVVQHLAGPLLMRMIHTKDGANVAVTCIQQSTFKERKKIIKGMKGYVSKIAMDEQSSKVLLAILDVVDDTKIVTQVIISELEKELKGLIVNKCGRRSVLHLLSPRVPRYFPPELLAVLVSSKVQKLDKDPGFVLAAPEVDDNGTGGRLLSENSGQKFEEAKDDVKTRGVSKKDPFIRRIDLLSNSFGKNLANVCLENAKEFLQCPHATDVIYEVAMGGADEVMWTVAPDEVSALHKAIADLAAIVPVSGSTDKSEHVLQQYHSSRTIRRLVMTSRPPTGCSKPSFSAVLWSTAMKGENCRSWAQGHSAKVVSAFWNCGDATVTKAASPKLQKLVDAGVLEKK